MHVCVVINGNFEFTTRADCAICFENWNDGNRFALGSLNGYDNAKLKKTVEITLIFKTYSEGD